MIRALALVSVFLPLTALAQSGWFVLKPGGAVAIPPSAAPAVFDQCSRDAPTTPSELWQPSSEQIATLESALDKEIDARRKAGKRVPPGSVEYARQYVGFTRGGERFIYGNFFPSSSGGTGSDFAKPVVVCDGGAVFWGIVYRVDSKSFEEPHFNGEA